MRPKAAVREMRRQVGDLAMDGGDVPRRGLIIRRLVLPEGLAGSEGVLEFIARELSPQTAISLMSQYFPAGLARRHPQAARRPTPDEYRRAVRALERLHLENGWVQDRDAMLEDDEEA